MDFDGSFRDLGTLDVTEPQALLSTLTEEAWLRDDWRQRTYRVHAQTQVIPLLYDEDFRYDNPTPRAAWTTFEPAVAPLLQKVSAALGGDGSFVRVILARLPAGACIDEHRDGGSSLPFVHRVHLPLITNSGVTFTVGGECRHLPLGQAYEINNRKLHSARNDGHSARVHLICDYVTPALRRLRELSHTARELLR